SLIPGLVAIADDFDVGADEQAEQMVGEHPGALRVGGSDHADPLGGLDILLALAHPHGSPCGDRLDQLGLPIQNRLEIPRLDVAPGAVAVLEPLAETLPPLTVLVDDLLADDLLDQ